jgi:hypothetical protein
VSGAAPVRTPLLFAEPGEAAFAVVDAVNLSCSWGVSQIGTLSCVLPAASLRRLKQRSVQGWWVRYDAGSAGAWGGIVTSETWRNAYVEIGCESFHALLRKRITQRANVPKIATAGSHFQRIVNESRREGRLPIYVTRADEVAPVFRLRSSREDIYATVIPRLIDGSGGQEWTVDADRNATWVYRLGRDKSDEVHFVEGLDAVSFAFSDDLQPISNRLIGVGDQPTYPYRQRWVKTIEHAVSINRFGVLEEVVQVQGVTNAALLAGPLNRLMASRADARGTLDLEIVERRGNSFATFREGDSVLATLPRANCQVKVRVLARSYNATTKRMALSCDVERWVAT